MSSRKVDDFGPLYHGTGVAHFLKKDPGRILGEMCWLLLCVALGVLSFGSPLDMLQSGSIIIVGELFQSTKRWELTRKRKVPEFLPKGNKKKGER
jgi:hypothetical protein